MTIAACLIVRDEERVIERCVSLVRPHVDEVNVYDTGSRDGTLELLADLAAKPGAPIRVERGEWRDDFSWARERSLEMASDECDWVLRLDADDVLFGGEQLRAAVAAADELGADALWLAWVSGSFVDLRTTLVRRAAGFRWDRPVHEQLIPPAGSEARFAVADPWRLRLDHDPAAARRGGRYTGLLLEAQRAGETWPLRYLARDLAAAGDHEAAIAYCRAWLARPDAPHHHADRLNALHVLSDALAATGDVDGARQAAAQFHHELRTWTKLAAGRKLAGVEALGPDFALRVLGDLFEADGTGPLVVRPLDDRGRLRREVARSPREYDLRERQRLLARLQPMGAARAVVGS